MASRNEKRRPGSFVAGLLCLAVVLVAAACAFSARRVAHAEIVALHDAGFVAWPMPGEGDYLWRDAPGRLLQLAATDEAAVTGGWLAVGFAIWMGGLGWLLRGTLAPYVLAAASVAFSVLVTGAGLSRARPPAVSLTVDVERGLRVHGAAWTALCPVSSIDVDRRAGARGGNFWVVARSAGVARDLTVFDDESSALLLRDRAREVRAAAPCGP